jgi:hypothetical protein
VTKKSYVIENGLTAGIVGLALVVGFAVGLSKLTVHHDHKAIKLPASIDGGYTLVDSSTPQAQNLLQVLSQLSASASKAEDAGAVSALYQPVAATGGTPASAPTSFAVTAVRKGSSTSPMMVPLSSLGTYSKVGEDTCFQASSQSSPYTACYRSSAEFTVEVTGSDAPAALAAHLDAIWKKIS